MIVLEIHPPGEEEVQVFTSDRDSITLGRHSGNHIRLEDDAISRYHAEIERRGDGYFIRDLDSRNGVLVNSAPVLEYPLSEGDEVRIGAYRLVFHRQGGRSPSDSRITRVIPVYPASGASGGSGLTTPEGTMDMPPPGRLLERLLAESREPRGTSGGAKGNSGDLLRLAADLASLIARSADLDTLLKDTLEFLAPQIHFTRGVALVWDDETRAYAPRALFLKNPDDPDQTAPEGIPVSMTIMNQCLERRQGVCCLDAMSDPRFASSDSIFDLKLHAMICVPLLGEDRAIGAIQVDSSGSEKGVREDHLPAMMLAANFLAPAVQNHLVREQKARRERRADEARVLAAASHCLHGLFVLSDGQLNLLRETAAAGDRDLMAKAVDQMEAERRSLAGLIEGLYDFVRGRVHCLTQVDVKELLDDLIDELTPSLDKKGIEIQLSGADGVPTAYFDREALRLLFLNVLVNAMESLEGRPDPLIQLTIRRLDGGRVRVLVQDNGCGMKAETVARAFLPFFTTKGRPHAGLGLTYARHIANAHGGAIEAESEPGFGTTLAVTFPLRTDPPTGTSPPRDAASSAPWLLEG